MAKSKHKLGSSMKWNPNPSEYYVGVLASGGHANVRASRN